MSFICAKPVSNWPPIILSMLMTSCIARQAFEASDFLADVLPPDDAGRGQALRDELQRKAAKP